MGGNGAYDEEWGGVPIEKRKFIEMDKRIDGHKILVNAQNTGHKSTPENSNSDSPIYLCGIVDKKTGDIKITTVAIYSKHLLVKTIDLEFDDNGELKPFRSYKKNGKIKTDGTHGHDMTADSQGVVGRKRHDAQNTYQVDLNNELLKKIVEFNKGHNKWK